MSKKLTSVLSALVFSFAIGGVAHAYASPEQVLFSDIYAPPYAREASNRVKLQQEVSAARREEEQSQVNAFFENIDVQNQVAAEEEESMRAAAPEEGSSLDGFDLELLRTIRLLERVENRQRSAAPENSDENLHEGAPLDDPFLMQGKGKGKGPPLTPTGAGSVVSLILMIAAITWTLWRAEKKGFLSRTL